MDTKRSKNFIPWFLQNWFLILYSNIVIAAAFQYALTLPISIFISFVCGAAIVWFSGKINDITKRRIFMICVPILILIFLAILSPLLHSYNLLPSLVAGADANNPGLNTYKRIGRAVVEGLIGVPFAFFPMLVAVKVFSLFMGKSTSQPQNIHDLYIEVKSTESNDTFNSTK